MRRPYSGIVLVNRRLIVVNALYSANPSSMSISSPIDLTWSMIRTTISFASSANMGRTFEQSVVYGLTLNIVRFEWFFGNKFALLTP